MYFAYKYVCIHTTCVPIACRGQKQILEPGASFMEDGCKPPGEY